jgi:hypothetical protein
MIGHLFPFLTNVLSMGTLARLDWITADAVSARACVSRQRRSAFLGASTSTATRSQCRQPFSS